MVSCCAAFGPNDSYFFNSPGKWAMRGLPSDLQARFTAPAEAKEVYDLALGPDGAFCMCYRDAAGLKLRHSSLPAGLETWLIPVKGKGVVRNLEDTSVVLGPGGSYWAIENGSGAACWGSLPPVLDRHIDACRKPGGGWKPGLQPQSVALGPDGAFVLTCVGGAGECELNGKYPALEGYLEKVDSVQGVYIILSPCRANMELVVTNTGGTASVLPDDHHEAYQGFRSDWSAAVSAELARQRATTTTPARQPIRNAGAAGQPRQSTSVQVGRAVVGGMKLLNAFMNGANGGGGGGGDYTQNTYVDMSSTVDTSSFWQPINSAASAPIQ